MSIKVDIYHHFVHDEEILTRVKAVQEKLDTVLALVREIKQEEQMATQQLAALQAAVAANEALDQSAIALIEGLAVQIAALKDDPAALQALADSLTEKSAALAAAIQANTPQA